MLALAAALIGSKAQAREPEFLAHVERLRAPLSAAQSAFGRAAAQRAARRRTEDVASPVLRLTGRGFALGQGPVEPKDGGGSFAGLLPVYALIELSGPGGETGTATLSGKLLVSGRGAGGDGRGFGAGELRGEAEARAKDGSPLGKVGLRSKVRVSGKVRHYWADMEGRLELAVDVPRDASVYRMPLR